MEKARRMLAEAQLLLQDRHTEGACNRAYYAMFNAAHCALLKTPALERTEYKTHRGLIAAFGEHIVQSQKVDPRFGRAINDVEKLRQLADYIGDPPPLEDAEEAVAQAFVAAIDDKFVANAKGEI